MPLLLAMSASITMPRFSWVANGTIAAMENHRAFGHAFGTQFGDMITKRFAAKQSLTNILKAAHTPAGAALYQEFLTMHRATFPHAIAELEGLAEGSGIDFETVFLQNINEEFSLCSADLPGVQPANVTTDACSDVMACDPDRASAYCAVAHNEDNAAEDRGTLVLVNASFGDQGPQWLAATYAGGLPSGAFGYSKTGGFGFTLNYVGPKQPACPGVGRGFISRQLLSAGSYHDALALITTARMGSGHNYQLFSFGVSSPKRYTPPRVTNVEVAPGGLFSVRPIGATPFFHANQYQTLRVADWEGNSTLHRLKRYAELTPPKSTAEMLHILGDQQDRSWPIFHDNASHARGDQSDWTMCTALFDLTSKRLTVYLGNPRAGHVDYSASLV